MNMIFEKMEIYDLISVLLSGVTIVILSVLIDDALLNSKYQFNTYIKIEDTFLFLVISYFIGIIFQEISSFIYNHFTKDNRRIIDNVFNKHKNAYQNLSIEEKEGICNIIEKELNLTASVDTDFLYNYCKFYLISKDNTTRIDKYQSIFGMSRSLSLYFITIFALTIFSRDKNWWLIISSIVLSVLFSYRCIRFSKMRYTNMFRSYYYTYLQNDKKNTQ